MTSMSRPVYRPGYGKYLRSTLVFGDFVVINLAWILADIIMGHNADFTSKLPWLLVNISFIPSQLLFSSNHTLRIIHADRVAITALRSTLVQTIMLAGLFWIFDINGLLKSGLIFEMLFWLMLTIWWIVSRRILKFIRRTGFNYKRVVIMGAGKTGRMIFSELESDTGYGYRVVGIFDDNIDKKHDFPGIYFDSFDKMPQFVLDNQVDIVYYTANAENTDTITWAMHATEDARAEFVYVPKFSKVLGGKFQMTTVGSMPAMTYTISPLSRKVNRVAKRVFDLLFSIPVIILSPIVFIPISIGIKLTSRGPVLFKQKRTGIFGHEFTCYKFRTMRVNKDCDTLQATVDDPRKTKFGDFLRRTSIDELPQFWNVFLGNMSVVGPRPHMISHTEEYSQLIDRYMVRHAVKPGITGWAQVSGYRGSTKHLWQMEKRVEYDVWYIQNWNLFLDIKIIFLTVFNALRGDSNAY